MIYLGEPDPSRLHEYRERLGRWPSRPFQEGQHLYQELQREPPRLLLLNLLLPGMDPFLMVRLLKFDSRFTQMPVLCLTPYSEPGLPDRLHRLGARGWLSPESEGHLLLEAVETLLGDVSESAPLKELPGLVSRAGTRLTPTMRLRALKT